MDKGGAFAPANGWEDALIIWLQSRMGAAGTALASVFSMLGEELVLILVMGFFYWGCDKKLGRYIAKCILLGIVINPFIKNIFYDSLFIAFCFNGHANTVLQRLINVSGSQIRD